MNVENLQKLYEVGQQILSDRRPLAFNTWSCGTVCCLGGWYQKETGVKEHFRAWNSDRPSEHFGVTAEQCQALFDPASTAHGVYTHPADETGPEAYAELERRMEYLADLIRKAGGTVPGEEPKGIPQSVRQIFETEVA